MTGQWFDPGTGRRYGDGELRRRIRDRYGVEYIRGVHTACPQQSYCEEQDYPIASFKNIRRAYKVSQRGGRFFRWKTESAEGGAQGAVVGFCMATGMGACYPQPTGYYSLYVNGRYVVDFTHTKYPQTWTRGEYRLHYGVRRTLSAPEGMGVSPDPHIAGDRSVSFGTANLWVPPSAIRAGEPLCLEVRAVHYSPSDAWVRIDDDGSAHINVDVWEDLERASAHTPARTPEGRTAFLGDIHAHSFCGTVCPCDGHDASRVRRCHDCPRREDNGSGCGYGSVRDNYDHARHVANLDFFCLTDHDFQLDDRDWAARLRMAEQENEAGRFAVLAGYEYTSWHYGHRNVYFRGGEAPIIRAVPYGKPYGGWEEEPPARLYDRLARWGGECLTVPHHMAAVDHLFNWDTLHPRYDVMVEAFSGWGDSESADTLLRGHGSDKADRMFASPCLGAGAGFGFVAGSDSHDGFPGLAQGSRLFTWANKFTEAGSGRTVALCDRLTREDVFDAIRGRRAYATSGAPILVDFWVNDAGMGETAPAHSDRRIRLRVSAPAPVERIDILKNGVLMDTVACARMEEDLELTDSDRRPAVYHARVRLVDREMAWITPVWVA